MRRDRQPARSANSLIDAVRARGGQLVGSPQLPLVVYVDAGDEFANPLLDGAALEDVGAAFVGFEAVDLEVADDVDPLCRLVVQQADPQFVLPTGRLLLDVPGCEGPLLAREGRVEQPA